MTSQPCNRNSAPHVWTNVTSSSTNRTWGRSGGVWIPAYRLCEAPAEALAARSTPLIVRPKRLSRTGPNRNRDVSVVAFEVQGQPHLLCATTRRGRKVARGWLPVRKPADDREWKMHAMWASEHGHPIR